MASVFKRGGSQAKGYYYASWFDHKGKRQTKCLKTTDKASAERIARKFEAEAALRRDGVIDPTLDAISKESMRTIETHLADYVAKLRTAGRTEKHIGSTKKFIQWISDHAGFTSAADISADAVNRYAGKLRDEGRAARTIQAHLSAIKAFTKWLADHHKLRRDPFSSIKKPNPQTDRRRERSTLLPEEWRRLEVATDAGSERYGMTPDERLLLYGTAIQTGLRSSELRSLTRGQLYLDTKPPYVTCKAGSTKNRKDARQYLQPELAVSLKTHIATKAPNAPIFDLPHESNLARMLRDDLAEARKAWLKEAKGDPQENSQRLQSDFLADVNHDGEVVDFHCLRHTCGAWLAMAGVPLKVVQAVMRHQSITLTMDTYGHLFPGQEADAVEQLRAFLHSSADVLPSEDLRLTGTDDLPVEAPESAQRVAQRAECEGEQDATSPYNGRGEGNAKKKTPKPIHLANVGNSVRDDATWDQSSGGGTRTGDRTLEGKHESATRRRRMRRTRRTIGQFARRFARSH